MRMTKVVRIGFFVVIMGLGLINCVYAGNLPLNDKNMVLACMGEAEGEAHKGKVAMLEALKNRGHLNGVYGHKSIKVSNGKYYKKVSKSGKYYKRTGKKYREIPKSVYMACSDALIVSKTSNLVRGADHWEAITIFGKPEWAYKMIKTTTIGSHTFYKSNK